MARCRLRLLAARLLRHDDLIGATVRVRLLTALTFGPGTLLGLSDYQVKRRVHMRALAPEGALHRTLMHVQFKAGEEVVLQELPKAFADKVVVLAEAQPEAPAESVAAPETAPAAKTAAKKRKA
jgi:hypothetical protein